MPTHPSNLLNRRLRTLGRTLILTELTKRLLNTLLITLLLLTTILIADALLELPLHTRKLLLIATTTITGILLLRTLITPITHHKNDEQLALLTEQQHPQFDSRLISSIQFTKDKKTSDGLINSMIADTTILTKKTNLLSVVDPRKLARTALILLATIAILATIALPNLKLTTTLIQRAFLSNIPLPRETQILTTTGDLTIGIGDQIHINATASGILPAQGTLHVKFASGRKLDYPLTKTETNPNTYTTHIEDVPETFTYQIRLNDARSNTQQITAFARPELTNLTATQIYPDYTGIEPTQHQPGDFYLFPGSQLTLQLTATKPLQQATLQLIGLNQEIPFNNTQTATFEVPTESLTGFSITLTDTDGMQAKDPAVYRAELLGDEPPKVRITLPTRTNELLTKTARTLIAFEATDRFGIASISLNYTINNTDPRTQELELPTTTTPPTSLKNQYDWDLKTIQPPLKEGDQIEYWITAQDRQKVTPGIGESQHHQLTIVTTAEKRQDLLSRATDYLGRVGATTEDQQRLNQDLGELIKAKK